jgi:hypothetical protein
MREGLFDGALMLGSGFMLSRVRVIHAVNQHRGFMQIGPHFLDRSARGAGKLRHGSLDHINRGVRILRAINKADFVQSDSGDDLRVVRIAAGDFSADAETAINLGFDPFAKLHRQPRSR